MNKVILSLAIVSTVLVSCGGEVSGEDEKKGKELDKTTSKDSEIEESSKSKIVSNPFESLPEGWTAEEIMGMDYLYVVDSVTQEGMSSLSDHYGEGFNTVYNYIVNDSLPLVGAPMSIWTSWNTAGYSHFQMGMPIAIAAAGNGIVKPGTIEAGPGLKFVHFGDYNSMIEPHTIINEWAAGTNITLGEPREVYSTDPGMEPDTIKWETEIWYPILNN